MYYVVYALLYTLSLLPFFILYGIGRVIAFLLYHVFKYRRMVVYDNICIAFPEKSAEEKRKIARQFYNQFCDSFIETLKLLTMSRRAFSRRATIDTSLLQKYLDENRFVIIVAGHLLGWEYGNSITAASVSTPFVGIYAHLSSPVFENLMRKIRGRTGALLLPKKALSKKAPEYIASKYIFGLIADQKPNPVNAAYWLNFFGRAVAFTSGPEKMAIRNNAVVMLTKPVRKKLGYYHFENILITDAGADTKKGEITRAFRTLLEQGIREQPANYLWSHRRWNKQPGMNKAKWVDDAPFPENFIA